jgi:hypothetical protein
MARMPDVAAFLSSERAVILENAAAALARSEAPHYRGDGAGTVAARLEALLDQLIGGIAKRDLTPITQYARQLAEERYHTGYELGEVQTAFNALEEAAWLRVLRGMEASELGEALGLISTVLGAGKDALARSYVSLASDTHVGSLDLRALFSGASS